MTMTIASSGKHRYIVALDFGTTNSGISHVNSAKKSIADINVINNWPGPSKAFDEVWKVPSRIAYVHENQDFKLAPSMYGDIIWGFNVVPEMTSYSWFKLRLDQNARMTEFDDQALTRENIASEGMLMLPPKKTAVQVCTDYLSAIYKYTFSELSRTWGDAIMSSTPIDFWITCPSTWSDSAKADTRRAALQAGFGARTSDTVSIIPEPEAAAVAALSGLVGDGVEGQLKVGDGVLVLDAGGGTCDLTTYRITAVKPRLEFDELAVTQGGKVGSTFVDRNFIAWLSRIFGKHFTEMDKKHKKTGPGSKLMKAFESHKRDFGSSALQNTYEVPLLMKGVPDSDNYESDEGSVRFTRKEMEGFFEPALKKIKSLLTSQLDSANDEMPLGKTVKTMILVGGFGSSQYLHDQLKTWCKANGDMCLICPPHPQAAIVRGAALRGLGDIKPSKRRCRRHYGFDCGDPFREGIDPPSKAYIDKFDHEKYCTDRMTWQIAKGDYVTEQTRITNVMLVNHFARSKRSFTVDLFACSDTRAPEYSDHRNVEKIATLDVKFPSLNIESFPSKVVHGKKVYELKFNIEVFLGDRSGVLKFRALSRGKAFGTQDVDFSQSNE